MKELLFMLADLWMIFAGFFYGWKFIRRYSNYLLGLEWFIVAISQGFVEFRGCVEGW